MSETVLGMRSSASDGSSTSGGIAVAMSGGLDSSVVAYLLAERAERPVIGLSMLLWDQSEVVKNGRCCGALDLGDARQVAAQIGIPHFTLRMDEEFREKVVDPFVNDYLNARTPSPCVRCNTFIKFDAFLERARELGYATMATGHYARIVHGPEGPELHRAVDESKDQSYYLFEMTREQLEATEFPLGELDKTEVRELARRSALVVAEKGESMEVCFVASGVREFVEDQVARHPERFDTATTGEGAELVDAEGRPVGEGAPYYRYTVGQRRGLGVSADRRLFVLHVDPAENRVTVGGREQLMQSGLLGERVHWLIEPPADELEVTVRIRSRHEGVRAMVRPLADGAVSVEFAQAQAGVAPGQAAVFYERSRVLGGCWIERGLGQECNREGRVVQCNESRSGE